MARLTAAGQGLNPFDIRATAWTGDRDRCRDRDRLNPFDIRATAWTILEAAGIGVDESS